MTDHSRHHKKFLKNRKAYSGILATIFMVLVILFLFFNVFMFMAQRNADLQDTLGQVQQMETDSANEKLLISDAVLSAENGQFSVNCKISNTGTLTSQLVRLWVRSTADKEAISEEQNPAITIQPAETISFSDTIAVSGASPSTQNNFWFVTARGNIVSASESIAFQQEIAKKIGSILLDWGEFRYYDFNNTDLSNVNANYAIPLPDPVFDFTVPKQHTVLFGIQVRNLDPEGRQITLTSNSFALLEGMKADGTSKISKSLGIVCVTSNILRPNKSNFVDITLDINVPTVIYFLAAKSDITKDFLSATLTVVLQGYTSVSDFSQTLPFGAIEFSTSTKQLYYVTGSGQTLVAGQISAPISVRRQTTNPDPPFVTYITAGDLTVALSDGGGKFYKDSAATIPITSIVIKNGESSAIFYYKDQKVESPTLKASAKGYTAASTKFAINAGTPTKLFFSKGANQTVEVNHESAKIKVQIQNQYGVPFKTPTSLTVKLSTNSTGGTFQHDPITINSGQSESGDFWYKDTIRGTPKLTASSGTLISATTTFTIR